MKIKFFKQPFMVSDNDVEYYVEDTGVTSSDFLHLHGWEWDNSLKIMQIPISYVFLDGFEKFGGMVGGLA